MVFQLLAIEEIYLSNDLASQSDILVISCIEINTPLVVYITLCNGIHYKAVYIMSIT